MNTRRDALRALQDIETPQDPSKHEITREAWFSGCALTCNALRPSLQVLVRRG